MRSNWTLFVPIYNLEIDSFLNKELKIDDILFVSQEKIPFIRKRLGLNKRVSEYQSMYNKYSKNLNLFSKSKTYAVIKTYREKGDNLEREFQRIKDSIYILMSSQFYRLKRTQIIPFGGPENAENLNDEYILFDNESDKGNWNSHRLSNIEKYILDKRWENFIKNHFFSDLLRILNRDERLNIKEKWWKKIRKSAILAGRSYLCENIWEALLFDIIAMETLLLRKNDIKSKELTERMFALFGWKTGENKSYWRVTIKRLYKLRSKFVHTGSNRDVKISDLIIADQMLYNLLDNICSLTQYFQSQSDIINMTKKLKARRALGQNMVERPPGIKFSRKHYNKRDITKLESKKLWE